MASKALEALANVAGTDAFLPARRPGSAASDAGLEILGRASRPERPRGRTDHPDRAGPPDPCSTTRPRAWTALPPFIKAVPPLGTTLAM